MVVRAAHSCRIFLEHAQPRNGFPGIEQDCPGAGDRIDISAREGRNARQMLQRVERRPFGSEHRARIAGKSHQRRTMVDAIAVLHRLLDPHAGIERSEESGTDVESGDRNRLAAVHLGGEVRVGIDRGVRGDVAARAEVFRKDGADELVQVEIFGKRHPFALGDGQRARQGQCAGSGAGVMRQRPSSQE